MTQDKTDFVATSNLDFPVTEQVMADILAVSVHWLRKDRKTNKVIPFFKMGGHLIRYIPSRVFKSFEQMTPCTTPTTIESRTNFTKVNVFESITLRDHFAIAAISASYLYENFMFKEEATDEFCPVSISKLAYRIADAMIKVRNE